MSETSQQLFANTAALSSKTISNVVSGENKVIVYRQYCGLDQVVTLTVWISNLNTWK